MKSLNVFRMHSSYVVKPLEVASIKSKEIAYAMTTHKSRYAGIMHLHSFYLMGYYQVLPNPQN